MQKEKAQTYYLVNKDILPEAILKTMMVKEIMARGEALTVNEAVGRVGLSRSAFYKYRDGIFPFNETSKEKIVSISLILEHKPGVLSNVLNTVAQLKGNILTINQSIPLQNVAHATLSIDTCQVKDGIEKIINRLYRLEGVKKVEIVGQS